MNEIFQKQIQALVRLFMIFALLVLVFFGGLYLLNENPQFFEAEDAYEPVEDEDGEETVLEPSVIAELGFINDEHVALVVQHCTPCHSPKLVTQNRMSAQGWEATISWMQETQNLWDLGENRDKIVAYLAKNYAPEVKGRRENLTNVAWYELE